MKNIYNLPFWELDLNPIDMLPPPEVPDAAKRKKYYKENKDTLKIKQLKNYQKKWK